MSTQFALDLRLARRKSGYTQRDVAHLMSIHQSAVSDLERGRLRPTIDQIIELSLIYGRSFESFFEEVMESCKSQVTKRLKTLPEDTVPLAQIINRDRSLKKLKQRLKPQKEHGGA